MTWWERSCSGLARRGDGSSLSRGKHWRGLLKSPQAAGPRISTPWDWWEQPCHRTELNHSICVVHKAQNSWVVLATLPSESLHERPRLVRAQSSLSLAAGSIVFHKLPLQHEFEQFGARTSLLFITCSQHESSVFASLERPCFVKL